jgi:CheY-like chemotaxis protein
MPKINGLEVLKTIRKTPELATLPVIMVTGNNDEMTIDTALAPGRCANAIIIKPLSFAMIRSNVAIALGA